MKHQRRSGKKSFKRSDGLPTHREIIEMTRRMGFNSRETRSGRPSRCGWRWRADARDRQAKAVKAAWASGRYAVRCPAPRNRKPVAPSTCRRIAAGVKRSWQRRKPVAANLRTAWASHSGRGRSAAGRPDHVNAKAWVIVTPRGRRIRCRNLAQWSRVNAFLFRRGDRTPSPDSVLDGIRQVARGKRRSYFGFFAFVQSK